MRSVVARLIRWTLPAALLAAVPLNTVAAPPAEREAGVLAVDGAGLNRTIANQRGKVVLVNLWATWCPPCVKEFPDLVRLSETHRQRGLAVIAVSLDDPHERGKVAAFAREQKARFPILIRKEPDVERFVGALDRQWPGAVPATYLFDRNGKRVGKPVIGGRRYEDFVALVEPLLGDGNRR